VLPRWVLAVSALLSTICGITSAQAAVLMAEAAHQTASACSGATDAPLAAVAARPIEIAAQSSKGTAILGGQVSALDQIRLAQQADAADAVFPVTVLVAAEPVPDALAPALGGIRSYANGCLSPASPPAGALDRDDFLASKRLAIERTAFDRDWQRVSGDRISPTRYRRLVRAAPDDDFSAIASVNSWVNRAITFTEDRDLFSRADHWAGAATTLKLRRGDCEDIALTKMQLLAAAGIPREDMILTIARDLVRNADHAVLIVRYDGQYYMLDNATDEVLDASLSHDYRPILSFGSRQTWLHGY
jgi:predicted transglutaminase-like cysteine proteinase